MLDLPAIKKRADFAGKNYNRLGSSWAEFYGRDMPQLVKAYEVLVALDKLLRRHASGQAWFDNSVDRQALARILKGE